MYCFTMLLFALLQEISQMRDICFFGNKSTRNDIFKVELKVDRKNPVFKYLTPVTIYPPPFSPLFLQSSRHLQSGPPRPINFNRSIIFQ